MKLLAGDEMKGSFFLFVCFYSDANLLPFQIIIFPNQVQHRFDSCFCSLAFVVTCSNGPLYFSYSIYGVAGMVWCRR